MSYRGTFSAAAALTATAFYFIEGHTFKTAYTFFISLQISLHDWPSLSEALCRKRSLAELRSASCPLLRKCPTGSFRASQSKLRSSLLSPVCRFLCFWSSPRPISSSQLHALLRFHLCPIYLVVFKGSYSFRMGYLILRGASRLDAFSVYPFQTWLLCHAVVKK